MYLPYNYSAKSAVTLAIDLHSCTLYIYLETRPAVLLAEEAVAGSGWQDVARVALVHSLPVLLLRKKYVDNLHIYMLYLHVSVSVMMR